LTADSLAQIGMVIHLDPDYTAKPATHVAGSIMPLSGSICPMTIAGAQKGIAIPEM
jgi:hypothetical protein